MGAWRGVIEEYRAYLPVSASTPVVSLGEGNTPLVRAARLAEAIAPRLDLYLKFEGANPTGSFKDRGMTLAISKAVEEGARAVMHRATVLQVEGNFDQALSIVKEISTKYGIILVNSVNPYRLEGQKTAAFEVCDQLGAAPAYHFLPVGNAGNITAYWKGYQEYFRNGKSTRLPRMMGFQAAGAAPIVLGHVVEKPKTIATAIRIGNPASWVPAVRAMQESNGKIDLVTDDEIVEAYRMVAALEGIFCEPASAASVAGVIKMQKAGLFKDGDSAVCTLTGHGLKDVDIAISVSQKPATIQANMEDVVRVLGY